MQLPVRFDDPSLREALDRLHALVHREGAKAYLVGGCVRDAVLAAAPTDLDVEVHGLPLDRLQTLLAESFSVQLVGRAFAVFKLRGLPIDVSLPARRTGEGPSVEPDPGMSIEEALSRRDFTMNAMAIDLDSQMVVDPFGGRRDLRTGILRHASDKFVEDPLRVLRAMQFGARFELTVAPETVALCRSLTQDGLPKERLFDEWRKLLLLGRRPSLGLRFLGDCGWLRFYPELAALQGCEQDPIWHPEGDVWVHTLHCLDVFAAERVGHEEDDLVVGFAVLCHDLGKPVTTKHEKGRITSKGHEPEGIAPTKSFLGRLTDRPALIDAVVPLVLAHLRPRALYEARASDSAIRRLARDVGRIDQLVRVARADHLGRPPKPSDGFPAGSWLLERAASLRVASGKPDPILLGRHLLELGVEPGPRMGEVLAACYEAQLDGRFSTVEEGMEYAKQVLRSEF